MTHIFKYITAIVLLSSSITISAIAQDNSSEKIQVTPKEEYNKAWEFGVGLSLLQHSNVSFGSISTSQDNTFTTDIDINQLLMGGHLYLANEIKPWLYWDIQGSGGVDRLDKKANSYFHVGPGVQFRFASLSKSRAVEPYLRLGINYFHQSEPSPYSGHLVDQNKDKKYPFIIEDKFNHERESKKDFFPFSLGLGFNSWITDNYGIGIQADYLAAFYDNSPHYPSVSMRFMYRIGGASHQAPIVREVKVEEKIKEVYVQQPPITVRDTVLQEITRLVNDIHFEFDQYTFTQNSLEPLNSLAELLKEKPNYKFLIIGYTDARGSQRYNLQLSKSRAKQVYDYLISRGVPTEMIKWRGVGKSDTIATATDPDHVREGDRRVALRLILNMDYWNIIQNGK